MSLAIYETADPATAFSVSGTFTSPVLLTFDGTTGGVVQKKYYVRNDSVSHTYSSIVVEPINSGGLDLLEDTVGFSWKLKAGNDQPLAAEWDTITAGASISLADIGDSNTYLPFWVRVEVPRATAVQSFDQVTLKISTTETLIP